MAFVSQKRDRLMCNNRREYGRSYGESWKGFFFGNPQALVCRMNEVQSANLPCNQSNIIVVSSSF